jgi:hypothetical protein
MKCIKENLMKKKRDMVKGSTIIVMEMCMKEIGRRI